MSWILAYCECVWFLTVGFPYSVLEWEVERESFASYRVVAFVDGRNENAVVVNDTWLVNPCVS